MYDEGQMMMVLELGLICSNDVPAARPSMRQLVRYLDGEAVLTENLTLPAAFDCGKIITKGIEDTELSHEHDRPSGNGSLIRVKTQKPARFDFVPVLFIGRYWFKALLQSSFAY
ncbi:hypothetical protein V6N11_078755 [Hibiscus sabdariffa]|uniref:Uncharacterized protein n=1 Tax=Hibiscus sabdariffa TaxID=183260 RepID=A0ABR2RU64_9ROSI